jgi:hypothetical protein
MDDHVASHLPGFERYVDAFTAALAVVSTIAAEKGLVRLLALIPIAIGLWILTFTAPAAASAELFDDRQALRKPRALRQRTLFAAPARMPRSWSLLASRLRAWERNGPQAHRDQAWAIRRPTEALIREVCVPPC